MIERLFYGLCNATGIVLYAAILAAEKIIKRGR